MLTLSGYVLSVYDMEELASHLFKLSALRALEITGASMNASSACMLEKNLARLPMLEEGKLERCTLDEEAFRTLVGLLDQNTGMERMDLTDANINGMDIADHKDLEPQVAEVLNRVDHLLAYDRNPKRFREYQKISPSELMSAVFRNNKRHRDAMARR